MSLKAFGINLIESIVNLICEAFDSIYSIACKIILDVLNGETQF